MASGEVEISFPDDPDAHEPAAPSPVSAYYADKTRDYFAGARHDIVALLPTDRQSSILEIGCGSGGTARAVRAAGKAGRYVGIELFAEAAEAEALSVVRAMLSSPQIFEMLEKLGLFELLPYLNRVFKNKTATRRKRQVAESKYRKYRNHACCIAIP